MNNNFQGGGQGPLGYQGQTNYRNNNYNNNNNHTQPQTQGNGQQQREREKYERRNNMNVHQLKELILGIVNHQISPKQKCMMEQEFLEISKMERGLMLALEILKYETEHIYLFFGTQIILTKLRNPSEHFLNHIADPQQSKALGQSILDILIIFKGRNDLNMEQREMIMKRLCLALAYLTLIVLKKTQNPMGSPKFNFTSFFTHDAHRVIISPFQEGQTNAYQGEVINMEFLYLVYLQQLMEQLKQLSTQVNEVVQRVNLQFRNNEPFINFMNDLFKYYLEIQQYNNIPLQTQTLITLECFLACGIRVPIFDAGLALRVLDLIPVSKEFLNPGVQVLKHCYHINTLKHKNIDLHPHLKGILKIADLYNHFNQQGCYNETAMIAQLISQFSQFVIDKIIAREPDYLGLLDFILSAGKNNHLNTFYMTVDFWFTLQERMLAHTDGQHHPQPHIEDQRQFFKNAFEQYLHILLHRAELDGSEEVEDVRSFVVDYFPDCFHGLGQKDFLTILYHQLCEATNHNVETRIEVILFSLYTVHSYYSEDGNTGRLLNDILTCIYKWHSSLPKNVRTSSTPVQVQICAVLGHYANKIPLLHEEPGLVIWSLRLVLHNVAMLLSQAQQQPDCSGQVRFLILSANISFRNLLRSHVKTLISHNHVSSLIEEITNQIKHFDGYFSLQHHDSIAINQFSHMLRLTKNNATHVILEGLSYLCREMIVLNQHEPFTRLILATKNNMNWIMQRSHLYPPELIRDFIAYELKKMASLLSAFDSNQDKVLQGKRGQPFVWHPFLVQQTIGSQIIPTLFEIPTFLGTLDIPETFIADILQTLIDHEHLILEILTISVMTPMIDDLLCQIVSHLCSVHTQFYAHAKHWALLKDMCCHLTPNMKRALLHHLPTMYERVDGEIALRAVIQFQTELLVNGLFDAFVEDDMMKNLFYFSTNSNRAVLESLTQFFEMYLANIESLDDPIFRKLTRLLIERIFLLFFDDQFEDRDLLMRLLRAFTLREAYVECLKINGANALYHHRFSQVPDQAKNRFIQSIAKLRLTLATIRQALAEFNRYISTSSSS